MAPKLPKSISLEQDFDKLIQGLDANFLIGVDEVGRGCLAGPVCAAAVIIPDDVDDSLYKDSKSLSASRRKLISEHVKANCIWHIAFASVNEISEINILQASLLAMKRSILAVQLQLNGGQEKALDKQLAAKIHVLVDGNQRVPGIAPLEQTTLIKGDQRSKAVAAASIIAKVERDELMVELSNEYPEYGFESHKGYSTVAHKAAIKEFGPTHVHRKTFAGVKEFV